MVNLRAYKPRTWPRLSRPTDVRMSMLKSMTTQLIEHERIVTTLANAKALQRYADGVIAKAKQGTRKRYDELSSVMRTDAELHKLFTTLALRYRDRPGGFTRVVPAGFRHHDATPMAVIELVDRPGELRPAARVPISPLIPPAARQYLLDIQQSAKNQEETVRTLPSDLHSWQHTLEEWRKLRQNSAERLQGTTRTS